MTSVFSLLFSFSFFILKILLVECRSPIEFSLLFIIFFFFFSFLLMMPNAPSSFINKKKQNKTKRKDILFLSKNFLLFFVEKLFFFLVLIMSVRYQPDSSYLLINSHPSRLSTTTTTSTSMAKQNQTEIDQMIQRAQVRTFLPFSSSFFSIKFLLFFSQQIEI